MRSEIRFFMNPDDYAAFERFLGELGASIDGSRIIHPDIADVYLQLLESRFVSGDLLEARVSLATTGFGLEEKYLPQNREAAERIYKKIRAYIKRSYKNDVIRWHNPNLPASATNPGKSDKSCWVGPGALNWWRDSAERTFRNLHGGLSWRTAAPN